MGIVEDKIIAIGGKLKPSKEAHILDTTVNIINSEKLAVIIHILDTIEKDTDGPRYKERVNLYLEVQVMPPNNDSEKLDM